jgi:hypothetical protein
MMDAVLLLVVITVATAAGLRCLRGLGALPAAAADHALAGLAVGLGIAGAIGLALAAAGALRPLPLALAGALALAAGGRELRAALRAVDWRGARLPWPLLAVCGLLLAAEVATMLAPAVGGDQIKYQLAYPRLYAARGALVPTPWSFWGQMQFLPNFLFAVAFALRGDVLARLLNGTMGVLAALALGGVARRLSPHAGAVAGTLFFTLPITWSLMTRAGSDLAVVLYAALAVGALLDWRVGGRNEDLRRAGLAAGLAGGSKVMGLLVAPLLAIAMLALLVRRATPWRCAARAAASFVLLVLAAAGPYYARNVVDTGNPVYPFAYGIFGGRHWSRAASEYLGDYYEQYRTTYATRREGAPNAGLALLRFPWDLTMHPDSFEDVARQALDIGPFALAFAPALLLVRRRRGAALAAAEVGLAYAAIVATVTWAHPRYVVPGVAVFLVATVPAARALLGRRPFTAVVAVTIAGNLALVTRQLRPTWPDQVRVAIGQLTPEQFLRRHSPRFAFWERANALVPASGLVLVLEKVPSPYYIERPFILGSYLEQGLLDYRKVASPEALALAARGLGVTHVAIDLVDLERAGDPFEASVTDLWRRFVEGACEPLLRKEGYALCALRSGTALAGRRPAPVG